MSFSEGNSHTAAAGNPGVDGSGTVSGAPAALAIPVHLLLRWQGLVETMRGILGVSCGRIVRVAGADIVTLVVRADPAAPYREGEQQKLTEPGLFSAKVVAQGDCLVVADASADPRWNGGPDVLRGTRSYLGYPIHWPDGTVFGVIDVLDGGSNDYPQVHRNLVAQFRDTIEDHIAGLGGAASGPDAEAFRISEERFRLLVENAADDFFLHDDKGRLLDVNRNACLHTGYSREELLQMKVIDLSIDLSQEEKEEIWRRTEPGTVVTLNSQHRRKDGTIFPVEVRISCHLIDGQKLFLGMVRDITERIEAEQAIRQLNAELEQRVVERTRQWHKSAALLQAVMDGATDAIFLKDIEGRILLFNRAAARFAGMAVEDVLGKTATELFGAETGAAIRAYELAVMASGEAATAEEIITLQGAPHLFLATRSPQRDDAGNVVGLIGISRDITEMKRAEAALRASEARWQFAVDGAGDGIWDWDIPSNHVFYSRQWKAMLGYADDEVGSSTDDWSLRIHPDDRARCWQTIAEHLNGATPQFVLEHRMRAKDGSWRWILDRGKIVERAADGSALRVIGTHTDITERKMAEDELRIQRERLLLAAEASNLGIWEYDLEANSIFCDQRCYDIFGVDSATPIDTIALFNSCVHPDDLSRVKRERLDALTSGAKIHRSDFRIVTAAGATRWISSSACLIERSEITPRRLVGIVMDVTASRLAEERLQRSNDSLHQAEQLARIGSWTLDLRSGEFSSSDMLYEMNGADPAGPALTPADLQRMLAPDGYRDVIEAMARCQRTGEPYGIDTTHLRPDGTSFAVHIRGRAMRDDSGQITSLHGTVQDVSEREAARAQLAALADNLPSGAIYRLLYGADGVGSVLYISAGIQTLVGLSAADIADDRLALLMLMPPDDRALYLHCERQALATRQPLDCKFRIHSRDGRDLWMQCRSAPSQFHPDGTSIWDGIIRDITAEQHAAAALREAKEAAEKAERAKSDFLSAMSHEIRTPMNTVIGMTRLTLQTALAPKQRNYLQKIDASAKTLLAIISDILDFSKIEAGRLEFEDTDFTLESVLETVAAVTAMRAEEKGLEFAFAVDPATPRKLRGDPLRLGQVLTNLIGNAIKFTEAGEIVVAIDTVVVDGATLLQFSVSDTGIGLDAGQIAGLFRPFAQADAHTSRRYGGTGLGLAISKQLVEGMGGTISVESEPGRGSTFRFTVRAAPPTATAAPRHTLARAQLLSGARVLVADDNASARQILVDMVCGFGLYAQAVASGRDAIEALRLAFRRGEPFDIVLMDWRMPGMDGLETARRIKADDSLGRMPAVLMVTAYAREEVLRSAEQAGLEGLLIKPVTESVMLNTIVEILLPSAGERAARDATQDLQGRPADAAELFAELAGRRALVVDDHALNREVACDFLLAAGMLVDTAVNGIDALEQIAAQPYDVVLMDLHMPEMDGLTATREIRRHQRWATLPIVALTAQALVEDRQAVLQAGMTTYLTKPIDELALYKTLAAVMGTAQAADSLPAAAETASAPADTAALDLAFALSRVGRDPERLERLLRGFLQDFTDVPMRMDTLLRAGDWPGIAALSHLVRGPAAYFGARAFCSAAARLEQSADRGASDAIATDAALFCRHLQQLLDEIAQHTDAAPQPLPPVAAIDADAVLALVADIEPLLEHGDYAVHTLLERIAMLLAGTAEAALVEHILTLYDELELVAAGATLTQLKTRLQTRIGGDPV